MPYTNYWSVLLFSITRIYSITSQQEYCIDESFNPQCQTGDMILMQSAIYGRMEVGRCLPVDVGYMGCQSTVLPPLDQECSGRTTCNILVTDKRITALGGCLKSLSSYLQAQYICVKGMDLPRECTPHQPVEIEINEDDFYLSDLQLKNVCSTQNNGFTLKVKDGQVMNISEVNLQQTISNDGIYGTLGDEVTEQRVVFGEGPRKKHLLLSSSNEVELKLSNTEDDLNRFMLHITVSGCPNMPPPDGAWMTRNGDVMEIGCHSGAKTWAMRCEENQWVGAIGQCGEVPNAVGDTRVNQEYDNVPTKLSINTMLFGICSLIIFLSAVIFLVGVCLLKRKLQVPIYKRPLNQTGFPKLLPQELLGQNSHTLLPMETQEPMYQVHGLAREPGYKSLRQATMGRHANAGNMVEELPPAYMNTAGSDAGDSVKYYVLEDNTK